MKMTKITQQIENRDFYCDTLRRYDLWNNKAIYLSPLFIPYIDLFLVKQMGLKPPKWKGEKDFCVALTHDVDTIGEPSEIRRRQKKEKKENYELLSRENKKISALIKTALKTDEFFFNLKFSIARKFGVIKFDKSHLFPIEKWLEFEEKLGIKSTFFFFPEAEEEEIISHDCLYKYEDKIDFYGRKIPLYEVVKEIRKLGWEIGIHGSILSAREPDIMRKQKKRTEEILGFTIKSVRHHYLSFEPSYTPYIQRGAGFEYDSTFGFNMSVGFRAGTSYPFVWEEEHSEEEHSEKKEKIGTVEVPPIIQDGALFVPRKCMGLDKKTAMFICKFIADKVREVGGVLTIIWHVENYFQRNDSPEGLNSGFLQEFLNYCKKEGAWVTSIESMMNYWQKLECEREIANKLKDIRMDDVVKFSLSYIKENFKEIYLNL